MPIYLRTLLCVFFSTQKVPRFIQNFMLLPLSEFAGAKPHRQMRTKHN